MNAQTERRVLSSTGVSRTHFLVWSTRRGVWDRYTDLAQAVQVARGREINVIATRPGEPDRLVGVGL